MKNKKDDIRPITKKQLSYLKRLIKYSHQRLREEDVEQCNLLREKIEEVGIENLSLELAKEYIEIFLKLEKAYKEQYENEAMEIDSSSKVIDLFSYKNS